LQISLNLILEHLSDLYPVPGPEVELDKTFPDVKLLSKYDRSLSSDVLYVTTEENARDFLELYMPDKLPVLHIICMARSKSEAESLPGNFRWIYISGVYHLFMLYNRVHDLFYRLTGWASSLNEIILGRQEMQAVLDASGSILPYAMMVWDAAFNVCAISKGDFDAPEVVRRIRQTGYFPRETVDFVLKRQLLGNESNKATRYLPGSSVPSGHGVFIRHYFHHNRRFFSMAVYADWERVSVGQRELMEHLFDCMGEHIARNASQVREYHFLYESFLAGLLDGSLTDPVTISEKAKIFHIDEKASYRIFKIELREFRSSVARYLIERFSQSYPQIKYLIYREAIVMLRDVPAVFSGRAEESLDRFEEILDTVDARCGISSTFHELGSIRNAYQQAAAALDLGRRLSVPGQRIYLYKQYYLDHLFDIAKDTIDMNAFYYKKLNILIQNDLQRGNNNIELLETYLKSNMSAVITAARLHLHRNSVIYRIKRIEELINADMSDYDTVLRIGVSLRALRYLALKDPGRSDLKRLFCAIDRRPQTDDSPAAAE
jgi:hypothetical protein